MNSRSPPLVLYEALRGHVDINHNTDLDTSEPIAWGDDTGPCSVEARNFHELTVYRKTSMKKTYLLTVLVWLMLKN